MLLDVFTATILGIVEGLTEFIPVSSTGHLLLVQHFFGFGDETFGKSFAVLIQLGAILALVTIYFVRLWKIALALPSDADHIAWAFFSPKLPASAVSVSGPAWSGDLVMMAVMGGMRTFWGPLLGATVFVVLQDYLSSITTNWMSFVGLLFVLVVLFFPRGLLGALRLRSGA